MRDNHKNTMERKTGSAHTQYAYWQAFIPRGTRAMLDDMLDLLFMVMIAFFALFFVHAMLTSGTDERDEEISADVANMHRAGDYLINQRINLQEGAPLDISLIHENVMESIRQGTPTPFEAQIDQPGHGTPVGVQD